MAGKGQRILNRKLKEYNVCLTCGKDCKIIKFGKTKWSKRAGMWYVCEDDHINKHRKCEYK